VTPECCSSRYLVQIQDKAVAVDKSNDVVQRLHIELASDVRQIECHRSTAVTCRNKHLLLTCLHNVEVLNRA